MSISKNTQMQRNCYSVIGGFYCKFFEFLIYFWKYLCKISISRCFKREFTEAVAIRMWEACWSNYLTDYFHLFLCLAIIAVYADDVIAQNLRTDEMLLHFSSLGESYIYFF